MRAFLIILMCAWLSGCTFAPARTLRTISISVKTPNPCWRIEITEVYRSEDVLFAVSKLSPPAPDMACAQVIATATDRVSLKLPAIPVRHLVLGQTWDWGRDQGYETVVGRVALAERLAGTELLYRLGEARTAPDGDVL